MNKRAALLLCVLALCASCQKFAEGRQMFHDLLALRDQLATQFHEKVVDVNISGGGKLMVKFINSPLETASHEVKQKRADEVAAFVMSHYNHPLSSVTTQFVAKGGVLSAGESFVGQPGPKP
jgi:hypothetical protein